MLNFKCIWLSLHNTGQLLHRHKTISDTAFATHKKGDSGAVSVPEGSSTAPIVCPRANSLKSRRNLLKSGETPSGESAFWRKERNSSRTLSDARILMAALIFTFC